jgi:hypothetical protein
MTRASAARLLWAGMWLLLPLPYFIIANGSVPVVRIALLSAIAVSYAGFVDGSGVAWVMAYILLAHVAVYSILLAVGAIAIAYVLPANARRPAVWSFIVVGFTIALLFDVYRTPFDDVNVYSNWIGLFQ